ncbi:MFS transporter [Bacillus paranthracis]
MKKMSRQEKAGYYTIGRTPYIRSSLQPHYSQFTLKQLQKKPGLSGATSTAYWGYANSFATLLISILAPILGTVADYKGFKKRFFTFFFGLGIVFTSMLAVVPTSQWYLLLGCYMLALVGFAGANIFL